MITKKEYLRLKKQNEEASKNNDYSKMIMMGSKEDKQMKLYEQKHICKHPQEYIDSYQGGQIDECRKCGKIWGLG